MNRDHHYGKISNKHKIRRTSTSNGKAEDTSADKNEGNHRGGGGGGREDTCDYGLSRELEFKTND